MISTKVLKILNADTSTGAQTGSKIYVGNARRIGVLLRRGNHTAGNTVFSFKAGLEDIDGSPTMSTFNMMLDNVTNSNVQNLTRVASKTLSSATDAILWVDPMVKINFIEVDWNTTTDGSATVFLLLEEET